MRPYYMLGISPFHSTNQVTTECCANCKPYNT